ncbi:MAG TPA: hypothetical protein VLI04_10090 [Nocardioidaceae bacterium]|nr:hypothetical protein [Nocardioidaceae bacterium]
MEPSPDAPERPGDRRFLLGAMAVALLLRFEGLLWPLKPDESGFLLVSRNWHPDADSLFGPLFVDRPPILIGLFRLADLLGGAYAPRFAAAALVFALVYAAYRTGLLLGGTSGARWTTAAAVALCGQPDLELWAAKSESLGVPLVMVSCWLSLEALYATERRGRYAFAAGLAGAVALGMKQNLVGGAVFGLVLLVVAVATRRLTPGQARRVALAAAAGFVVVVGAVVAVVLTAGVRLGTLWETLYGFRGDAFKVITSSNMDAPMERLHILGLLFVTTGLALLLGWFLLTLPEGWRAHPEAAVAALVMVVVDAVALLLGGSYWVPYLTGLFPGALVAVAIVAGGASGRSRHGMRIAVVVCSASMVVTSVGWSVGHLQGKVAPTANYVGAAVKQVALPDDTIVVLYGRADVVLASGLDTVYEHLWSVPARTLDPELEQLRTVLAGEGAPTWVVAWTSLNAYGIDPDGRLQALVASRYYDVGKVCGRTVYRLRSEPRPSLPYVDCDRPWL